MFYDKEDAKPPPAPLLFQIQNLILVIHKDKEVNVPKLEKYLGPAYLAERAPGESLREWVRGAVTALKDRFDESPEARAMSDLEDKLHAIKENKKDLKILVKEYLEMNHFAEMRQEIPPMFNPDRHPRQQQGTEGVKELLIQEMSKIFPGFKEQKGEEKNPKEKLDGGRRTRRKRRRKKKHRTGIHMKRKTHKHKKKHRRKTKRKRRVKRRRRTRRR